MRSWYCVCELLNARTERVLFWRKSSETAMSILCRAGCTSPRMNAADETSSFACATGDGYTLNALIVLLQRWEDGTASEWIVSPEKFWNADSGANIAGMT